MSPVPVLIASPFLGPAVWGPVERELREVHGLPATTVGALDLGSADPTRILAALHERLPLRDDLLLVPHSNAGLYVPSLLEATRAGGAVFVDAVLPPSSGSIAVAPPALRRVLTPLADDAGLLPGWTRWWPEPAVAELFPDSATRTRVETEQKRLPAAYLDAEVTVPDGWDDIPGVAYLAFGDAYAEEAEEARRRGWPVSTMAGNHLHMLCDPVAVAADIVRLSGAV